MGMKEKKLADVRAEILAERAASLKASEQRLRDSLAALAKTSDPARRARLLETASTACLTYVIQREALGMTAPELQQLRSELRVPDEVWNGMGAMQSCQET
jgi:uncharacterized protein DUF6665